MKIGTLFTSRFLRADDLGSGRVRVTIEQITIEALHGSKKPVLHFRGKTKGLVLNQTRARSVAAVLATEETDDWIGCEISLYVDGVTVTNETDGRKRHVRMICVDERPESARRPDKTPSGPLSADQVRRW